MRFGAACSSGDTQFRLWAPDARTVVLRATTCDGEALQRDLNRADDGWFELAVAGLSSGSRYLYYIDDDYEVPDPASRFNPQGVHAASEVVDPGAFEWQDADWRGRPWHEAVLYELHVGAFTTEGTFDAVLPRLRDLVELGITAIELMPVATFAGERGWGYDGVLLFAPHAAYGRPEDLKRLVQSAHQLGLMVILDVVYNHFGPEGNYLPRYAGRFFTDKHCTPWGNAIDFEGNPTPRRFFIDNALYWLNEYHLDGLRLDAIHAMLDSGLSPDSQPGRLHIVDELAMAIADGPARSRRVHLVLENYANQACRLAPLHGSAALLSRAQWNDDFHHALHVLLTAEDDGHYADYIRAPLQQLGRVLAEGFAFQGEPFTTQRNEPRGEKSAHLPPTAFINFLQNHDQIGNRALGERLGHLIDSARLRAGLALLLLSPAPPLLFMGEEYAAPQPFQFFCDYHGQLGAAITAGRRSEFAGFRGFAGSGLSIPDPNDPATFARSKLAWSDRLRPPHDGWLTYVRMLLAIRAQHIVPLVPRIVAGAATYRIIGNILVVIWTTDSNRRLTMVANLAEASSPALATGTAGGTVTGTGERIFSTIATAGATLQPWEVRVQLHSW